ncbi:hypothetical protein CONPUDRAFT_170212 [Coniophora puteana RWD-64-598 SS2]|uniref:Uncharacterized protein n=1 Tax=Coniophora puteana (strain RWD-64-598) TaxID=741705 RepID=R7SDG1_CONPW|nr:uncharacterized protein CONPUDRAFT_170212 [Coniophora puteana RWD-64-598 SS2]EIW74188.1 hypothetical protein CONPUDRAFT_170212 [Coniophora puteana RWD-64-598 SS2]
MDAGQTAAPDELFEELQQRLSTPEPQLSEGLSGLFTKMRGPPLSDSYVFTAMQALQSKVANTPAPYPDIGSKARDPLTQACIRAGMIDVLLTFIHVPFESLAATEVVCNGRLSQWMTWHMLVTLTRYGTLQDRKEFLDKLIAADIIQLCLETTYHHSILRFRGKAAELLGSLASQTFLIQRLSASTVADILSALYTLALQDPEATSDQLTNPQTNWQHVLMNLDFKDPWNKDRISQGLMANRYFGQAQDFALHAARDLVTMNTQPSPRYNLDVFKHKASIMDLLLDCLLIGPLHCYPECTAAYVASNNLAAFFRWPISMMVPGVSTPADQAPSNKEWKVFLQTMQVLTSCKDWAEKVVEAWMKTEPDAEDNEKRNQSVVDARLLYSKEKSPLDDEQLYKELGSAVGCSRVSVLRLITTLSHGADAIGIRNIDIYAFLPIAYRASQKTYQEDQPEVQIRVLPDWLYLGGNFEREGEIDPYFLVTETMLGPTAYARLLVVLAQRNALKSVQSLQKPPTGLSPTTSLAQLRQITHPDVISRFLNIAIFRVQSAMEKAEKVVQVDMIGGGLVFEGTAELAAAMVAFDDITGGEYATEEASAARHYLSMALQHISGIATKLEKYRRAYLYLAAAVAVADTIKEPRAGWTDFAVKLKRQLRQAKRMFETRQSADRPL